MNTPPFQPYIGQHCETTATGTLLKQFGLELSEPLLFGLGEGLSFIFWNMKNMAYPFIGGRVQPDAITQNIAKNLHLQLTVKETTSPKTAWENVRQALDNGQVVGLKLDCFHLEYFGNPIHFAAHYVAMYGYDHEYAYLVDTCQQGSLVKTSLPSLALARREKGAMSSKNLSYTLAPTTETYDLKQATRQAIQNNCQTYLNPPIKNLSYKGILKASTEIVKWFQRSQNAAEEFKTTAVLMERAGTGGALFRNLYRDFLQECVQLHQREEFQLAYEAFVEIAPLWTAVASLFNQAGSSQEIQPIYEASEILKAISAKEKTAMTLLNTVSP